MNTKFFFKQFSGDGLITLVVDGETRTYNETEFNELRTSYRLVSDRNLYRNVGWQVQPIAMVI
jgi:hypothetical protein